MSNRVRRNLLPCSGLKSPFYPEDRGSRFYRNFGTLFCPEDGGGRFLRNVGTYLPNSIVSSQRTVIFIGLVILGFLKPDVS
jgi:hypothetical protein